MRDHQRCSDPETLAAFVDGLLSVHELRVIANHLRECENCRAIVADVAWIDRDIPSQPTAIRPRRSLPWWIAIAASLASVVFLALWQRATVENASIQQLVNAMPSERRHIEPRLTGFPWAPLRVMRGGRESIDPQQLKLLGAAGSVLEDSANDSSIDAKHAAAVAHLVAGNPEKASTLFKAIVTTESVIWSDRAAALYTVGVANDDPIRLAEALAAADEALRLNPQLPEALFNRALTLEHLGLRDHARTAWQHYLKVETNGDWAREARQHVAALQPFTEFSDELRQRYAELSTDAVAANILAQRFPQEVRVWGESEILLRWAVAFEKGDVLVAATHLSVARNLGNQLSQQHGDKMLRAAVEAIDGANPKRRHVLAEAHATFREAQRSYKNGRVNEAEAMFKRAATDFRSGGSPLASIAEYFTANTMYDQGRVSEARRCLERLATAAPPSFVAHRAQVQWQLGLVYTALGEWGDARRALHESIAAFEQLGEKEYARTIHAIVAEVYARIGEPRKAQRHYLLSWRLENNKHRLQAALSSAAATAARNGDLLIGISLLGLALELGSGTEPELARVELLLNRARLQNRVARVDLAVADLARANEGIAHIDGTAIRARAEAEAFVVSAELARSPIEAVSRLTRAIEFQKAAGRRMLLPELYLQRGRALKGSGADASDDFEAGIRELENQSASGEQQTARAFTDPRQELFEEAIADALSHGDASRAFAYLERSRTSRPTTLSIHSIARDKTFVAYAALPDRLVIFVAQDGHVRAIVHNVSRKVLATEAARLANAATTDNSSGFRNVASRLYQHLFAPVAKNIETGDSIVFIPDDTLSSIPFAALLSPNGRYVIQAHRVSVAHSVTEYAQALTESHLQRGTPKLLLITGPARLTGAYGSLFGTKREADAIAAIYDRHTVLMPSDEVTNFESHAGAVDIIHFAGHAIIPDDNVHAALVTSRTNSDLLMLTPRDISHMRLLRTRVVILAACGTALGHEGTAPNDNSIARAFLAAGVPSVLGTLWSIEDQSAAEFFPRLHEHLAEGRSPAEALRLTQLEWLQRPQASIGMWAGVQVIGN